MPFERIVATALEIVDAEGADALTFRALAQRLGSSTATLYRHLDSRAELLGHVVERVFGEVEFDLRSLEGLEWWQACRLLATSLFDAVARHPRAAPLLIETVPTGPQAMAFRELCLSILLANGFHPATARTFTAMIGRFVIGFALQLRHDSEHADADAQAGGRLHRADPALYPAISRTATEATVPLADESGKQIAVHAAAEILDLDPEHPSTRMVLCSWVGAASEATVTWLQDGSRFTVEEMTEWLAATLAEMLRRAAHLDSSLDPALALTALERPEHGWPETTSVDLA